MRESLVFEIESANTPTWAWCITKAEAYGIPPWQLWDEMSRHWYERINALDQIRGEKKKRDERMRRK